MKTQNKFKQNHPTSRDGKPTPENADGNRNLRTFVYSNPIRAVLCILYAAAAFLILSRQGLLPRILTMPRKDGSIAVNSVFYYTGNSFNNLVQNADSKRIPAGTIDQLDLFSATNYDGGVYYSPKEKKYYFNHSNFD